MFFKFSLSTKFARKKKDLDLGQAHNLCKSSRGDCKSTGCPKKKCDLRLNAPRGLQKGATEKSFQFNEHRNFIILPKNA